MNDKKYMSVKEFFKTGLLQELNRQFLHPRGLALEVVTDENNGASIYRLGHIWDYRDDPEGILFDQPPSGYQAQYAEELLEQHSKTRKDKFGWVVQPTGE
jgi:hypothetical protein